MKKTHMNRRKFLKAGALGTLGAGAIGALGADTLGHTASDKAGKEDESPRVREYNILGKTGLKVSDISMGIAREPAVYHFALDQGVNFFDTAESYYKGQHERDVGRAFKKVRDKVIITTKHHLDSKKPPTKKELIERFDQSLERLGFDYVDIAMWHMVEDEALLKNEEILAAYETLKKAGKYRFLGFSTHNADKICPPAYDSGLFSAVMLIYNSVQYPDRGKHMARAKELGIGTIAMKTMGGREQDHLTELAGKRTTYSQAAIKWALTDRDVDNVVITMRTFEHVEEYLQASGQTLSSQEKEVLKKYVKAVDNRYCRIGCSLCHASCPHDVAINDIMRFGMYYENYGEEKKAMLEYASLDRSRRASPCRTCSGACETACPHRLFIRDRLVKYDDLLRVC
ncbi:MAG: aldo/keto reductase [Planctomycetota bacterium]|jgi:predicted aldo/keto reductase-like oxidoreductase